VPPSLEQYAREIALAGRDGEPATCTLFYDANDRAKIELGLSESRIAAPKLSALAKTLELSAIDGHPRTLESLALSSGTSRRTAETVCRVLEDAGLISLASGWCRTRVPPQVLCERVGRLAAQLGRLRAEDERRVAAATHFASTPECKTTALTAYFGDRASERCNRCSSCRGNAISSRHSSSSIGSAPMRRRPAETLTFRMRLDNVPRPAPEVSVVRAGASRYVR
jgi:ATP-dependent DNA helicase RecQ